MSRSHSSNSNPPTQNTDVLVESNAQKSEQATPKLRGMFHLLGAVACIPATYYLLAHVYQTHPAGSHWYLSATVLYMLSLFLLMSSSAIYHVPKWPPSTKAFLRRVDHAMIYILIAGSLTPFLAVLERLSKFKNQ